MTQQEPNRPHRSAADPPSGSAASGPSGDRERGARPVRDEQPDAAAVLGHGLKNSLYAIMLQAEFAQSSAASGDAGAAEEAMRRVRTAAQEATRQLDGLLKIVRERG